ncbi:hypothetical protein PG991_013520 [Apiospora marii]|uniref:Uncharacterized protein n=1 Tax=Apiospora marii TaxID=335849 RepID=A0ABR1R6C8_9PEZI
MAAASTTPAAEGGLATQDTGVQRRKIGMELNVISHKFLGRVIPTEEGGLCHLDEDVAQAMEETAATLPSVAPFARLAGDPGTVGHSALAILCGTATVDMLTQLEGALQRTYHAEMPKEIYAIDGND